MDPQKLNDFATRYTAAWCSQDAASVASFFSQYATLQINEGVPAIGREAITAVVQGFMTAFPDLEVRMDGLDVTTDHVKYVWTLTGTNDGPDSTGNKVHIGGYEQWIFDSEHLHTIWRVLSSLTLSTRRQSTIRKQIHRQLSEQ